MNKFHLTIIIYITLLFFASCTTDIAENINKIDYSKIEHNSSREANLISSVELERIQLEQGTNENNFTTMSGEFLMKGDTILFADRGVTRIFMYHLNGKRVGHSLTKGRGPNDIISLENFAAIRGNSKYAVMGNSWDLYILDDSLNVLSKRLMSWGKIDSDKELRDKINNPDPNDIEIYEKELSTGNVKFLSEDKLLFPIVTDHVKYNGFFGQNAPHFYENSNTLGIYNLDKDSIEMAINRSPIYGEYKYLSRFKNILIETIGDTLYYSFEADPKIYKYNINESVISSFGEPGENMNTKYVNVKSFEAADKLNKRDFGYYLSLTYIEESSLLFRTYHKGENREQAGMQIYRDGKLIADCEVPKSFRIIGYNAPYYYGYGEHDNENFIMHIYRFKL